MTKWLEGQTALVTGASRGIGAATALALANAGAHVILTARTAGGLEEVEDRIFSSGGSATIAPADLIETDSIGRLAVAVFGRWKSLDILVLNAATLGTLGPVPHIDPAEFSRVLTLNVAAQQAMIAAFDRMLRASRDARVIGLTSSVATKSRAYWGGYAASKAAFEALIDAYGEEHRNIGHIRTAIVDPGATATQMRARAYPGEDAKTLKQPNVVGERIAVMLGEPFATGHRERIN